ncbi:NitT/TauT family transport system ATP-binding protein [Rhodoblastus acidophilus]|uniref:ABC transporter ATP-binding protein n=1 Tax=Rhodoblastus acidophilus TaxID=1074 RepID=UPI002224240E|nr:ABC transporter ATP-binding protein [Rhodoblastus acidophilus]MCW2285435.1 NitT/TauT family transport system ATP-binding protein [Rhodoblastus acidophilus]MCW2334316.1 NitT/TauT family transport system ATP-binding protein [Rhodoblastus acidophilus]
MLNVAVANLSFAYDETPILAGVDMQVEAGSFVCLLGQSGCGKSTLLRLLAGLEKPSAGQIRVEGRPIAGPGLERGVVFQDYGLFPWMSASENIAIALKQKFKTLNAAERRALARERLAEVELPSASFDKFPGQLSGGMRQRCAIARAFAIDPPILLMDEPFAALDAVTRARLQELVIALWRKDARRRKTVFFVTHDVDEALTLATDIYVLGQSPGRIVHRHSFGRDKVLGRDAFRGDPGLFALRSQLIGIINEEVSAFRILDGGLAREAAE